MVPGLKKREEHPDVTALKKLRMGVHPEDVLKEHSEVARLPEFWKYANRALQSGKEPKDAGIWMAALTKAANAELDQWSEKHVAEVISALAEKDLLSKDQLKRLTRIFSHRYRVLDGISPDVLRDVAEDSAFVGKHPEKAANILAQLAKRGNEEDFFKAKELAEKYGLHEHIKRAVLSEETPHPTLTALAFALNLVKDPEFAREIYNRMKKMRFDQKIRTLEQVANYDVKDPESALLAAALFRDLVKGIGHQKEDYAAITKAFVKKIQEIAEQPGNEEFKHAVLHLAGAQLAQASAKNNPVFAAWLAKELIQNYDVEKMKGIIAKLEELTGEKYSLENVEREMALKTTMAFLTAAHHALKYGSDEDVEHVHRQTVRALNELGETAPSKHFMWRSEEALGNLTRAAMLMGLGSDEHRQVFEQLVGVSLKHPNGRKILAELLRDGDPYKLVLARRALEIVRAMEANNTAHPEALKLAKNVLGGALGRKIE